MVKNANFRGLRRIWEFLRTLCGVIILPPSQPRFLARFPRWEKFECEARAFFLALCPKKIKTIHLTWYNSLGIWRWLLHGLPKRQSLSTTVLFRGSEWGDRFDGWQLLSTNLVQEFKVAEDTLGSLLCIYLKRMHEVSRLILTGWRDIHNWIKDERII